MSISSLLSSISGYVSTLDTIRTNIRSALANKGVSASNHDFSDFASDIASIPEGLTASALSVTTNGTYTAPTGTAYTPVTVAVGQVIPLDLPDDGKTRIRYKIPENADSHAKKVTLMFYHATGTTATSVDWGDGSAATSSSGSGRKTLTHTYSSSGEYTAAITISAGTIYFGGGNSYTIYGSYNSSATIYQRPFIQWIVLGTGVTKLDTYALYYCTGLQEIRFPSSGFTAIGQYAISYCRALKEVTIPNTVTSLGTYAFYSSSSLKKAVLPTNTTLKTIPGYCFRYCYGLEEVTIPSQFTTIGEYCFDSCYQLSNVTLPSSLTTLNQYAFNNCMRIAYLAIPSTVTSISDYALGTMSCLQKLRFNGNTPPTLTSNAIANLQTTCVISVPTGKKSTYTSASNYPSSSTYTYIAEAA